MGAGRSLASRMTSAGEDISVLKRNRCVVAVVVSGVVTGAACVRSPEATPPPTPAAAGEEDDVTVSREDLSALVGSWTLVALDGEPVPAVGTTPTLEVREDGAVGGTSGVNRYMARLETGGLGAGRIGFGPAAGTKMAGPPEAMELERLYLDRFGAVGTYELESDTLRLFAGDSVALTFERAR